MKLIEMRPEQVRAAAQRNTAVLIAAGVVEYHGPHLPVGTDFLIANSVVEGIERRCEVVVAPPLPLGPTGSWAAGPEDGEFDFPPEPFFHYAKAVLRGLLDMGFRRIFVLQHHQSREGVQSLCLQRAAAELALEDGRAQGHSWGQLPRDQRAQVFGRVRVLEPTSFLTGDESKQAKVSWGHASFGETSYILGVYPHLAKMENLPPAPKPDWLKDSAKGNAEVGRRWFEVCVNSWVRALTSA
ncbi:MAG: creatininase family protein [Planctomycetes bacterium]|nr:creatininase family protein [Planctomycetota bacterium]